MPTEVKMASSYIQKVMDENGWDEETATTNVMIDMVWNMWKRSDPPVMGADGIPITTKEQCRKEVLLIKEQAKKDHAEINDGIEFEEDEISGGYAEHDEICETCGEHFDDCESCGCPDLCKCLKLCEKENDGKCPYYDYE